MGTYVFYGLVTASASGIFGAAFLDAIGVWNDQPDWAGFLIGGIALVLALLLTIVPAKRAASILLTAEGITVVLILVIAVVVLVRMLAGNAPGDAHFTIDVFKVAPGTDTSTLFLGIVFGLLSFAGFEAAATLGEEAHDPKRDIPRAILGTAIFGGIYFTVVTAIEMMAFGPDEEGVAKFIASPALMGDLGTSYIGSWVGDLITLGRASAPSPAAWPAWSARRGCCSRWCATSRRATPWAAPEPTTRRRPRPAPSRPSSWSSR